MGGKITQCVKSPSSARPKSTFPVTLNVEKSLHLRDGPSQDNTDILLMSGHSCSSPTFQASIQDQLQSMFTACQRGHVDQFQHIIETKPSLEIYLNTTSNFSVSGITMSLTPLQTASCCGHEELASYILTFPNVLPNQQDPTYGMTALHLAIFLQQRFVVETLCRDGRTDPNQTNCEGKSCLQMAVERSNIAAVETLFRLKPNLPLDTKDLNGNTLLHAACVYPNQQLLKLLLFHTESANESFIAGQNENRTKENISLIKLWRKATFHISNHSGETPIQILRQSIKLLESQSFHRLSNTVQTMDSALLQIVESEDQNDTVRIFKILEEERNSLLEEARLCLDLLKEDLQVCESFESLSSALDLQHATTSDTVASKLNLTAISWSPRNESFFSAQAIEEQQEDNYLQSPLSINID